MTVPLAPQSLNLGVMFYSSGSFSSHTQSSANLLKSPPSNVSKIWPPTTLPSPVHSSHTSLSVAPHCCQTHSYQRALAMPTLTSPLPSPIPTFSRAQLKRRPCTQSHQYITPNIHDLDLSNLYLFAHFFLSSFTCLSAFHGTPRHLS